MQKKNRTFFLKEKDRDIEYVCSAPVSEIVEAR